MRKRVEWGERWGVYSVLKTLRELRFRPRIGTHVVLVDSFIVFSAGQVTIDSPASNLLKKKNLST